MELDHGSKQNTSNQRGSYSLLQRHDGPISSVAVLTVNDHHYTNIPKIVIAGTRLVTRFLPVLGSPHVYQNETARCAARSLHQPVGA